MSAGFEQCRQRVLGHIDEMLKALEERWGTPPPYYMEHESGQWLALDDLKTWIKGQVPGQ